MCVSVYVCVCVCAHVRAYVPPAISFTLERRGGVDESREEDRRWMEHDDSGGGRKCEQKHDYYILMCMTDNCTIIVQHNVHEG